MRSHISGVLIALILSACTPGSVQNRVYADPSDGPAIVFAAAETLSKNHMKRPDRVALLNAAVGGLGEVLRSVGVEDTVGALKATEASAAMDQFETIYNRAAAMAWPHLDAIRLQYGAATAMARSLGDSHTKFLPPNELSELAGRLEGQARYAGIGGISIERNAHHYVWYVYPGGPAAKAGLQAFDRLTHVDGESVDGVETGELARRIRGLPGTHVMLTVQRPSQSEPLDLSVVRERLWPPSVDSSILDGGLGFVRSFAFSLGSAHDMLSALNEFETREIRGLVLDLRDNEGGYTSQLDQIASMLLPPGRTIYTLQSPQGSHTVVTTRFPGLQPTVPLVILINRNTASVAEVLAAAISENGRGKLLGERTKGAAELADLFRLPGGTAVLVATARIVTSRGVDLEGNGLSPDFPRDLSPDDLAVGVDSQLSWARHLLLLGSVEPRGAWPSDDRPARRRP